MLAAAFAGCGDSAVEEGTVPFKNTDTSQFEEMTRGMKDSMSKKSYTQRPVPPKDTKSEKKKS
jgi:hypothetical protein